MSGVGASKTVAIDVDSVLADVMLVWTNEYNKRKHSKITKNEITVWDIPQVLPISVNEVYRIFSMSGNIGGGKFPQRNHR